MAYRYEILGSVFATSFIVFNVTKHLYNMDHKLNLLDQQILSIKEKISDLELFKAKVYNNEVIPGRRLWDQFGSEDEDDDELD